MSKKEDTETKLEFKMNMSNATIGIYAMLFKSGILHDFDARKVKILYDVIVLNKSFTAIANEMNLNVTTITHIFWEALSNVQDKVNVFSAKINFIEAMDKRYKMLEAENIALQNIIARSNKIEKINTITDKNLVENIDILNISNTAINALNRSKVFTIKQLILLTEEQLFSIRNISDKTIASIKTNLKNIELSLATNKTIKLNTSTRNFYFEF